MFISHHESNNNMFLQQTWPFLTDPDSKYLDDFKKSLKKTLYVLPRNWDCSMKKKHTPLLPTSSAHQIRSTEVT